MITQRDLLSNTIPLSYLTHRISHIISRLIVAIQNTSHRQKSNPDSHWSIDNFIWEWRTSNWHILRLFKGLWYCWPCNIVEKMSHYGIRGNALKWFESCLSNRKQYVTYNGISSVTKTVKCGVPQGSILGPLLFLIYINDLCSVCKHTFTILFADDTNLFSSGKEIKTLETNINNELSHTSIGLKVNKLSLNIKKIHYMIFRKRKKDSFNV